MPMREKAPMKVKGLEILRCDAGWRNYHFLKLMTDEGVVGWSEFDEGFGSPGVGAVIERLAGRVVGKSAFDQAGVENLLDTAAGLKNEERPSRSEQRTDNNQNNYLTGKAPYK